MTSIFSALKHDLGIVEGILIPGASVSTVNLTHSVQQPIAHAYGTAIGAAVTSLVPVTAISGPEKALAIANTVANDIIAKGVKAEFKTLRDAALNVVQAAYRAIEPSIGADIVALASAFHAGPVLTEVAELAGRSFSRRSTRSPRRRSRRQRDGPVREDLRQQAGRSSRHHLLRRSPRSYDLRLSGVAAVAGTDHGDPDLTTVGPAFTSEVEAGKYRDSLMGGPPYRYPTGAV